jgi:hypothetical protein
LSGHLRGAASCAECWRAAPHGATAQDLINFASWGLRTFGDVVKVAWLVQTLLETLWSWDCRRCSIFIDLVETAEKHAKLEEGHAELKKAHAELEAAHAELKKAHAELEEAHAEQCVRAEAATRAWEALSVTTEPMRERELEPRARAEESAAKIAELELELRAQRARAEEERKKCRVSEEAEVGELREKALSLGARAEAAESQVGATKKELADVRAELGRIKEDLEQARFAGKTARDATQVLYKAQKGVKEAARKEKQARQEAEKAREKAREDLAEANATAAAALAALAREKEYAAKVKALHEELLCESAERAATAAQLERDVRAYQEGAQARTVVAAPPPPDASALSPERALITNDPGMIALGNATTAQALPVWNMEVVGGMTPEAVAERIARRFRTLR